jgi:hypothetical protein
MGEGDTKYSPGKRKKSRHITINSDTDDSKECTKNRVDDITFHTGNTTINFEENSNNPTTQDTYDSETDYDKYDFDDLVPTQIKRDQFVDILIAESKPVRRRVVKLQAACKRQRELTDKKTAIKLPHSRGARLGKYKQRHLKEYEKQKVEQRNKIIPIVEDDPDSLYPVNDMYLYSIPNSKLLTLLIIVTILLVVVFLVIFRYVTERLKFDGATNNVVGNYLSVAALPIGVVLAFVIATASQSYNDAQTKENQEATQLLLLYNILLELPDTEDIQEAVKTYTSFIITNEFPLMEQGMQSHQGLEMIFAVGDLIYGYDPHGGKQDILYKEAIDKYNLILSLRIIRMEYAVYGLAPELWWVLVLGVIIIIFLSFFLYLKCFCLQVVLVCVMAVALVSLLFLVVALNFPYKGDYGLDSLPFQIALANMNEGI